MGWFTFQKGYYAYTGSALGDWTTSLRKRVARHVRKNKVNHWHIDFLLSHRNAGVVSVVAAESSMNIECQVNRLIKNIDGAEVSAEGFGASDCKQNCRSHLVYLSMESAKGRIIDTYRNLFGQDKMANLC